MGLNIRAGEVVDNIAIYDNFGALVASKGKSTGGSVSTQLCENGSKIKGLYGNVGMFENSTMVTALGVICGINQW